MRHQGRSADEYASGEDTYFLRMCPSVFYRYFFSFALSFQRYVCGQQKNCGVFASPWALERAKENVQSGRFAVVGLFEQMPLTLQRMEEAFPNIFKGISLLFNATEFKGIQPDLPLRGFLGVRKNW